MRGKRAKQYRKLMHQYALTFNFHEPYQVLVDSQFVQDAARFKMDPVAGLERTLQGQVKTMITQCSMRHLYTAEPKDEAVIDQAKAYERRRCNHHTLEQPLSTLECFMSVIDPKNNNVNKHRYVVATQDKNVRAHLRRIPGVPLVYIHKSVMIMEPMADATTELRDKEEKEKFRAGLLGKRGMSTNLLKRKAEDNGDEDNKDGETDGTHETSTEAKPAVKKRKKGPKAPNPLSVKKSKKREPQTNENGSTSAKKVESNAAQSSSGGLATAKAALTTADGEADETAKKKRKRKHKSKAADDLAKSGTPPDASIDT